MGWPLFGRQSINKLVNAGSTQSVTEEPVIVSLWRWSAPNQFWLRVLEAFSVFGYQFGRIFIWSLKTLHGDYDPDIHKRMHINLISRRISMQR